MAGPRSSSGDQPRRIGTDGCEVVVKTAIVIISYVIMGWVAALLTEWLEPFAGIGTVWKPALIGWVLWTMSGFVDSFFPRGTVPSNK